MQKITIFLLVICGLVLGGFGVASANLITNGDFESGSLDPWAGNYVSVATIGGSYAALLDTPLSTGMADLSQSFSVAPGTSALQVSFDYLFEGTDTSWLNDDGITASISISTSNFSLLSVASSDTSFGKTLSYLGTIDLTPELQALASEGKLNFALFENYPFMGDTDTKLYVDNVNISAVPVPNALLLFGSGLAGLVLFSRKFVR